MDKHQILILLPSYSARAITSGGTLETAGLARIKQEFLEAIKSAPPVDGVYFSLHGAMSAEGEDDPEGMLLTELRQILGEDIPIVASFDLHGIITERILQHCNAIVAYHTYPHVDFFETGARAAKILVDILNKTVKPVTARIYIPALVRGPELITATGQFGQFIRQAQSLEASELGLSAGMFIGNPFTDVLNLASNSFVVANGDANWAKQQALSMAQGFWAARTALNQPLISIAEAVHQAEGHVGDGTVVLVDAADATSSGASGDSNAILRGLLEGGYTGRSLTPIVDAPAVALAKKAGIGAQIELTLGGQLDAARFEPLPVQATVKLLSDGHFLSESYHLPWYAGDSAVLQVDQHRVVAISRPVSLYDRSLFYAHGQNPQHFDAVVVKSPYCEEYMFAAWAKAMLNVDAPGSTSANLPYLGHTQCKRPIFPLDEGVKFEPQVQIYQRE